jgi:hypothetical protein
MIDVTRPLEPIDDREAEIVAQVSNLLYRSCIADFQSARPRKPQGVLNEPSNCRMQFSDTADCKSALR